MGTAHALYCSDNTCTGYKVTMERNLIFLTLLLAGAAYGDSEPPKYSKELEEKCIHKIQECIQYASPLKEMGTAYLGSTTSMFHKTLDVKQICSSEHATFKKCYAEMKKLGCEADSHLFDAELKYQADTIGKAFDLVCLDENKALLEKMKSTPCFQGTANLQEELMGVGMMFWLFKPRPCEELYDFMSGIAAKLFK